MAADRGILAFERNADDARALLALQRAVSDCADLDEVHRVLERGLVSVLPVQDRVSIALLEPDGEWLRIYRLLPSVDLRDGTLPRVRVDGTPVGRVVRDGIGRVVGDVRADPNITFGHASHDGIRSTVSVPVKVGGRVVGALNAGSRTPHACTEAMLQEMADIAAVIGSAFYAAEQAFVGPRAPAARSAAPRDELISASPAFRSVLVAAQRTARSDVAVLLTGETGVGKTALARAVHAWSSRQAGPFVTVHLGDLTPTLVESELFGYERGAFTGATAARAGRFELARGGTLFFDEISEAPLAIQSKLLRVIQDRCFERVGSGTTITTDVRIIAATSRDLRSAIRAGEFREDLYFRLGVVPLHVPPLRERRDDLEPLVASILARFSEGRARTLTPAAWSKLRAYAWPGNIRELESVLRRATILEEDDAITLDDFAGEPTAMVVNAEPDGLQTLDENERAYIERVLALRNGVIEGPRGAARVLGVPPSTLRSRMKRLGISAQHRKGSTP